MVAPDNAKRTLSTAPSEADQALLERAMAKINQDRFSNQLSIPVRWAIPSAVEAREHSDQLKSLPKEDQDRVAAAMQAYAERDFARARDLIQPLCGYGLRPINGLYISTLRHLRDESWFALSQRVWVPDTNAPAAASIESEKGVEVIRVHPSLSSSGLKAPRFVLNYVLYHEGLHKLLDTTPYNPHPPLFRQLEALIERREDAITWLRKHRFATIEEIIA